jgi:tetraacyldisaccharide-1-P 4'-kinase
VQLQITSVSGQVVFKNNLILPMGNYQQPIDVSSLASGDYLINILGTNYPNKGLRFIKP